VGRPAGTRVVKPRHLYVHAPFCARRCSYCDFAVRVDSDPPVDAWAAAIGRELDRVVRERAWVGPLPLATLYVGGGTPSLLGIGAMDRLRRALGARTELSALEEFTAEANPESFSADLAADWRRAGIDRISFGAQTFHGPSLRWMGRLHGPDGPGRAVGQARAAGFANVSLDLIFGLPARLGRDLDADLDRVLALEPEHVSVYGLTVEPDTPLGRWVSAGRETVADADRYRGEYLRVARRLRAEGYHHYEVSNFARPGREARHNAAYWRGVPYLGLGNGAHSFVPPERWWNPRDWDAYRKAAAGAAAPREGSEVVAPEVARLERVWLGLRTSRGLSRTELGPEQWATVERWQRDGLAESAGDAVRLTLDGWLLIDRLAVDLDTAAA
jgi:oxygen-independent coproporphyrinogen-3 oxidase